MKADAAFFSARVRRNLGFKLLGTAVEKLLRLALVAAAARMLGTAAWGRYTYALTLALLLVQITDMGLALFTAREIARDGEADAAQRGRFVGQVLTLKALLSSLYLVLVAGLALAHLDEPVVALAIAVCGVGALGTSAMEAMLHVFRGVQDLALEARAVSLAAAGQLVAGGGALLIAAWVWDRTLVAAPGDPGEGPAILLFCAAMAAGAWVGTLGAWRLLRGMLAPRWGLSPELWGRFRREVLPLGIAIVAALIYYRIDVPMIRHLRGDVDTGLYTAAYKILEYGALLPSMLMAATFPALSEALGRDPLQARALHRTALAWLGGLGLLASAALWLAPELVVWLLYGEGFGEAAPVLQALAPCVVLTWVNYLLTHMLVALGLVRAQMLISLLLVGLNVGLNWWWIPLWGGRGAAWATAVTELGLLACCAPLVWRGVRRAVAAGGIAVEAGR